ncbi:hypothetical protein E2C01_076938 [Portunus trituberculatus]|uniref:Uncharacterized protein n=1 Tax=Portunus trituberculatus TaxID=210409 RepID=A0A5B7IA23_PORTR|nr:hypothetical protein [Portunus trituberculatus]
MPHIVKDTLLEVKMRESEKTQLLLVSRLRSALRINFNWATLSPQEELEVLGVTYDQGLTFRTHNECLAKAAYGKL